MTEAPRLTLRNLPLPAKLVVSAFLMAVGIGYFSALVQLHFQHSDRDGTPMPTKANVIAVFAGKKWQDGGGPPPKSKLESIISGPRTGPSAANMTPAFFGYNEDYKEEIKTRPKSVVDGERETERLAVVAWTNADPDARKASYERDTFEVPAALVGKEVAKDHQISEKSVKIRSILAARCCTCHAPGKDKSDIPLDAYEHLDKLMKVGQAPPPGGGWVDSGKQIGLVKLTQSTHAHLLSFSVLFSLTGLVFAFSSYPTFLRCILGPLVVIAQFLDVSCWWLARLPEMGPFFASCIIATGGVVGMGLAAQIVLSLFNLYGPKGKAVLMLIFLAGIAGLGFVGSQFVKPFLDGEKPTEKAAEKAPEKAPAVPAAANGPSHLEKLVTGPFVAGGPWSGKSAGGMVRAFFDKETEIYKPALKDKTAELAQLTKERETEQALMIEWLKLPDDARKKAYEADSFAIPDSLAKNALTTEFKAGSAAKVKSLLNSRCVGCHSPDGDKADAPLDTYANIAKYFGPPPPTKEKADAPKGVDPIPKAGD